MKRVGLIPLFCLFLLCGSIFPTVDAHRYCRDSTQQLQTMVQAAQSGQWDAVRRITDTLLNDHASYQRRAGWYVSDSELYALRDTLYALDVSADAEDALGLSISAAHVRASLEALVQGQSFAWDALL